MERNGTPPLCAKGKLNIVNVSFLSASRSINIPRIALLIAVLLAIYGITPPVFAKDADESLLKIKTIKQDNHPQEEDSAKSVVSWSNRSHPWVSGSVKNAKVNGAIKVTVESETRSSGGITVELFCQDNIGHFMPIWGGSVTTPLNEWAFTQSDIRRNNIDGCYFGVVDTTAEMETMR